MKNSILIFGTQNFNNTLKEIKGHLDFSLIFYEKNTLSEPLIKKISLLLVDSDVYADATLFNLINKIKNKPLLLLKNPTNLKNFKYLNNLIISFPLTLTDLSTNINSLIITTKFNQNSSIKIKEYEVNKNERIIKKKNLSLTITEREIQLIELLFNEKKPLSKNTILKTVWKYADDTDTHTIETHIYRLRKKILNKFKDENFIINSKDGYFI